MKTEPGTYNCFDYHTYSKHRIYIRPYRSKTTHVIKIVISDRAMGKPKELGTDFKALHGEVLV